eukprot:s5717_g1.t1
MAIQGNKQLWQVRKIQKGKKQRLAPRGSSQKQGQLRRHWPLGSVSSPPGGFAGGQSRLKPGAAQLADAFVAAHTAGRATAASQLLDAVSGLDNPQVGLRSSGGHCRMVHSMRCTPPAAQLDSFKPLTKACLLALAA